MWVYLINKKLALQDVLPNLPKVGENNLWYVFNQSETVFVFVHGILSDSRSCWLNINKKNESESIYWPELIVNDKRFNSPSIYLAGFYTERNSGTYQISDCANEILSSLKRDDANGNPPPLSKKNIVFITHSTGGIVIRYMLERNHTIFSDKNIGLALIASPSYGAKLANKFNFIMRLYNHKLGQQLMWGNDFIEEIDDRFRDLVNKKLIPSFFGVEAYENHFIIKGVFFNNYKVVCKESAGRYFGTPKQLPDTDHYSCVKPNDINHPGHTLALDLYDQLLLNNDIGSEGWQLSASHHSSCQVKPIRNEKSYSEISKVLFDIYREEYDQFYIEREIDSKFNNIVALYSVWISGPSGCGKTCLVQRNITKSKKRYIYISLASCINFDNSVLFRIIETELYEHAGVPYHGTVKMLPETIKSISDLLASHFSNEETYVLIEEIPLGNIKAQLEFAGEISALLISYANKTENYNAKIILSSIFSPESNLNEVHQKIKERVKFLSVEYWDDVEIRELLLKINKSLNLNMTDDDLKMIVDYSNGSPRFVKKFIRDYLSCSCDAGSFETILKETRLELS